MPASGVAWLLITCFSTATAQTTATPPRIPSTTINGIAVNCEMGKKAPVLVDVYVLDSATVPRLVSLIKMIENRDAKNDSQSAALTSRFDEMIGIMKKAKPLLHTHTDRTGSFTGEIPAAGKVIVLGYAEVEDHPYFYSYKQLAISGRNVVDVTLDFGGYCSNR